MIAWALTYLLHSTLLILVAWALTRPRWGRASSPADAIWKCALVGALATATLQQATGGFASLALPIRVPASPVPLDTGIPAPAGGSVP